MHQPIWEECKRLGIVADDARLIAHSIIRAPARIDVNDAALLFPSRKLYDLP